ncbi:hypothetical protein RHSIM_Rhsim08G0008200 [Rhododendron simsii]|uniref:Uncharacterized protein n=1 Tax=Rhododendron simsii TaxID=118357 RepID=A0A834LJE0_RHOSS|nr:hypothetical protein RHSIM_Rhsim08G0008200 [Rhododendron simsii]
MAGTGRVDGSDGRCGCLQVVSCRTVQMEINNCGSVSVKQSMLTCTGEALAAMLFSALVNTQVLAQTHGLGGVSGWLEIGRGKCLGLEGAMKGLLKEGVYISEEDLSEEDGGDIGNNPNDNNKSNPKKGPGGGAGERITKIAPGFETSPDLQYMPTSKVFVEILRVDIILLPFVGSSYQRFPSASNRICANAVINAEHFNEQAEVYLR